MSKDVKRAMFNLLSKDKENKPQKAMVIHTEKFNQLPIEDYSWIFNINQLHRPSDSVLELLYKDMGGYFKSQLKALTVFWDSWFENSEDDSLFDEVEEWIERVSLLKEAVEQIPNLYINLTSANIPGVGLPAELQNLPVLGHIPGMNPHLLELNNNLDNDLTFPELQEFLGREIVYAQADLDDVLAKAEATLEKYDRIYLKWLGKAKLYRVTPLHNMEEVKAFLEEDLYMFEMKSSNKLAIQEGLSFEVENRFFVINGEIIAESANFYNLTPIHPITGEESWHKPLFSHYSSIQGVAIEVVKALKEGDSLNNQTYVLDVAWDNLKQQAVVVELNPIHNSGLYRSNVSAIVKAAISNPNDFKLNRFEDLL